MSGVPSIELNNGVRIPQLGLGVYKMPPEETAEAVASALRIGYRHIDTAQMYRNEAEVGEGIRRSGLDPAEVFVTSKVLTAYHEFDAALRAFDRTLDRLGSDTIDLFLIHWPLPKVADYVATWRALERIYAEGRARAVGVSNFTVEHLERLADECDLVPAVDQIELHPYLAQRETRRYCAAHGIAVESWSPLVRGDVLDDPTIVALARGLDRTPAQVVLRWHVQSGCIVIPKSVRPERMKENFEIFDFELDDEQMASIATLDRDGRIGTHPDDMNNEIE